MIEAYFRPIYQQCLIKPILKLTKHTSPTTLTALACLFGILIIPALYLGLNKTAVLLLLISGYLDTLDGSVARSTGKFSESGAVFDLLSDRIVEFSVILGLFAVDPLHRGWLALAMLGSCYICITCFLIIGLFVPYQSFKEFNSTPGIIERTEVFIFFIFMILMPSYFSYFALLFIGLILLTSYLHLRQFMKFISTPLQATKIVSAKPVKEETMAE